MFAIATGDTPVKKLLTAFIIGLVAPAGVHAQTWPA
jgi:hypothetical protein